MVDWEPITADHTLSKPGPFVNLVKGKRVRLTDTYLCLRAYNSHGTLDVYSQRTFNRHNAQLAADDWVQERYGIDYYTEFDRTRYESTGLASFTIRRKDGPVTIDEGIWRRGFNG